MSSVDHSGSLLPPGAARWASRVALISLALLIISILLHRFFSISTPLAMNLVKASILGGLLTIVLSIFGIKRIWQLGATGLSRIVLGMSISLILVGWPLYFLFKMQELPSINDVTTDFSDPPLFLALKKMRSSGANSVLYPPQYASLQSTFYPDLKPLLVRRSNIESFQASLKTLKKMGMRIVTEDPPGKNELRSGLIEATDRTLILGFTDDVVIRIVGNSETSRIDIRSSSRYGQHDLGKNATRIREILRGIVARFEATVPTNFKRRRKKSRSDQKKNR